MCFTGATQPAVCLGARLTNIIDIRLLPVRCHSFSNLRVREEPEFVEGQPDHQHFGKVLVLLAQRRYHVGAGRFFCVL